MERPDWRGNLAGLLRSLKQVWNLKARVALGATVASVVALGALPSVAQAKVERIGSLSTASPKKEAKLGSMFVLKKANGGGKVFAEHGSHRSHSSHRSHRSGAWVR